MAKIPIPATDEELNTNDPMGSGALVVMLALGFAILLVAAQGGQWLYNQVAGATPDQIGTVEVL